MRIVLFSIPLVISFLSSFLLHKNFQFNESEQYFIFIFPTILFIFSIIIDNTIKKSTKENSVKKGLMFNMIRLFFVILIFSTYIFTKPEKSEVNNYVLLSLGLSFFIFKIFEIVIQTKNLT